MRLAFWRRPRPRETNDWFVVEFNAAMTSYMRIKCRACGQLLEGEGSHDPLLQATKEAHVLRHVEAGERLEQ